MAYGRKTPVKRLLALNADYQPEKGCRIVKQKSVQTPPLSDPAHPHIKVRVGSQGKRTQRKMINTNLARKGRREEEGAKFEDKGGNGVRRKDCLLLTVHMRHVEENE